MICPRSAILQSAAASIVAGIFELTVSTAARIATFGCVDAERDRQIDRVLADVDLVLERRRDVDRRVGDDEHLVIGRHVHDEHVADAAAGAQPGLARDDRAEQLVGVQAALHQQLGLALAHQLDGLRRRRVAVRRVDDPRAAEVDAGFACAISANLRGRADEDRHDQPLLPPPRSRRPAPSASQGCATAVGTGSRLRQRSSSCSYFPVPVSEFMMSSRQLPGPAARRRSGLFQEEREHDRQADAVQQRLRTPSGSVRASSAARRR